ncbi:hypothetical protein [Enterovibrio calviensis]|uniref:hypothetical protein n=1 Tax=Enterovibrio calviensis TaxID=91359 RepID=UPI0004851DF1|nr:hypothetical protein [Enterovibrio calviensis]
MSTVNINLTANTSTYVQRLKDAKTQTERNLIMMEQRIDKFARQSKRDFGKVNDTFDSLSKVTGAVGAAIGAVAAAGAFVTVTTQIASTVREMENMSRVAGMAVPEYQAMSYAAKQYGLDVGQMTSASKDALEKIGDYLNTGGGGLQDFADAMGMTTQATTEWAESMKDKSGLEVLQRMYTEMEQAGLSSNQMSNALEGMGSDLTYLMPLLANGGMELSRLTDKFKTANTELSPTKTKVYKDLAENVDLLAGAFTTFITNALAPSAELFSDVSLAAAEFLGSMNEITVASVQAEIDGLTKSTESYQAAITNLEGGRNWFGTNEEVIKSHREEIAKNVDKVALLNAKLDELKKGEVTTPEVIPPTGDVITPNKPTVDSGESTGHKKTELDEIAHQQRMQQIKLQSALTIADKLAAQKELDRLNNKALMAQGVADQQAINDLEVAQEYQRIQAKAAATAEGYANEHEAQIEQATLIQEWLKEQYELGRINKLEHDELMLAQTQAITEAETALMQQKFAMVSDALSGISTLFEQGSKEQKIAFAAEKGVAIAEAMLMMESNAMTASSNAMKSPAAASSPDGGLAMATAAATMSKVKDGISIAKMTAAAIGQFHSGSDEVDQTGSYILKAGERVIQPTANKDLTQYLKTNKSGSEATSIKSDLVIQGDTTISEEKFLYMLGQHRESLASFTRMAQRENPNL